MITAKIISIRKFLLRCLLYTLRSQHPTVNFCNICKQNFRQAGYQFQHMRTATEIPIWRKCVRCNRNDDDIGIVFWWSWRVYSYRGVIILKQVKQWNHVLQPHILTNNVFSEISTNVHLSLSQVLSWNTWLRCQSLVCLRFVYEIKIHFRNDLNQMV